MRERDIQAKVVGYARARRVICRKLDFGEGWPDYLMLFDGKVRFMEFKGEGGRVRPLQEHVFAILKKAGFEVMIIDSVAEGEAEIDALTDNAVVDYSDIVKKVVEKHR